MSTAATEAVLLVYSRRVERVDIRLWPQVTRQDSIHSADCSDNDAAARSDRRSGWSLARLLREHIVTCETWIVRNVNQVIHVREADGQTPTSRTEWCCEFGGYQWQIYSWCVLAWLLA